MAKKAASKARDSYIAKAPIRRLMRNEGAQLVSKEALMFLIDVITKKGQEVTKASISVVKADKRKKITSIDILDATA